MYRLRRLRLDNIGHSAAGFKALMLDFTGGGNLVDGRPLSAQDVIVWLRNGGGKSSLLSLFFSLLLPAKIDFIGHAKEKSLADYVPGSALSHVVAEWEDATSPERGAVLVTGGAYQWREGTRPLDPGENWERLIRRWYLFRPVPGVLDLDSLPVQQDGSVLPQPLFLRALAEAYQRERRLALIVAEDLHTWDEQLVSHGLDPQVFKIQRDMNRDEGDITKLFQFASCEEFLDFLIDLVVGSEVPDAVREALSQQADKLAMRPDRELEQKFLAEAVLRLRPVQAATTALSAARAAVEQEVQVADRACEVLRSRAVALEQEALAGDGRAEREQAGAARASARTGDLQRREVALVEAAARCERDAALGVLTGREEELARALTEREAWEVVEPALELEARQQEVADLRIRVERFDREQAPLREAMERAGAALCQGLDAALAGRARALETARQEKARADRGTVDAERAGSAADQALGQARLVLEQTQEQLAGIDQQLTHAHAEGLLAQGEDPAAAAARWSRSRDEAEQAWELHRDAQRTAQEHQQEAGRQLQDLEGRLAHTRGLHEQAWDELESHRSTRRDLAGEARLREVACLDEDDELDIEGVGEDLLGLLEAQIGASEASAWAEQASAAEDRRVHTALERDGFWPPSRDIEQAAAALADVGAQVLPGLQFLRDTLPVGERTRALAAAPHVAGGVVVTGPLPEGGLPGLARRVSVELGAVVTLCTPKAAHRAAAGAVGDDLAVLPLNRAALDPQAADEARTRVGRRLDGLQGRIDALARQREADRTLHHRLRGHLALFGAAACSALEARVARLDGELSELTDRKHALVEQAKQAQRTWAAATDGIRDAHTVMLASGRQLGLAVALAESAAKVPALRDAVRQARTDIDTHSAAVEDSVRVRRECESRARTAAAETRRCEREMAAWTRERDSVAGQLEQERTWEQPPGHGISVDLLRGTFEQAHKDWLAGIGEEDLARRLEDCQQAVQALTARLDRAAAPARDRAAELAHHPDAATAERRATRLEQTVTAVKAAETNKIHAEVELEHAARRHRTAEQALQQLEPAPAALTYTCGEQAAADLAKAREQLAAAQAQARDGELAAERAGRDADRARSHARALAQAVQAVTATVERHRAGDERPSAVVADIDAVLFERHRLHAGTVLDQDRAADLQAALTHDVEAAAGAFEAARTQRERTARKVERLAQDPVYTPVVDRKILERLREDLVAPARLAELVEEVATREKTVTDLLAELAEDQLLIVQSCMALVKAVLGDMKEVAHHSRLPQGLASWSGQQFLQLEVAHPAGEPELQRRLGAEVDRMVGALPTGSTGKASALPDAMTMTKRLVLAALGGPGHLTARIIKPTQSLDTVERTSVTLIRKFSGGELLTVSVLLYCTLARMRAAKRDRKLPGGVGVLMLDNPFGKANYRPFIGLQRRVAGAHGIQLVYATGTNDLPVLGSFPVIVRLRNGVDARTQRRYVQIADRYGDAVRTGVARAQADGITSARLMRQPDPEPGPGWQDEGTHDPDPGAGGRVAHEGGR